jgi:hypothetical protein
VRSYEVIIGCFIVRLCRHGWSSRDHSACRSDTLSSAVEANLANSLSFWAVRHENLQLFAVSTVPAQPLRFTARHPLTGASSI